MRNAFTLIELLVVITIIVVLLAMLTPALDRAIYQTELTVCGTQHRSLGTAVTSYAMDHQRRYPYRSAVHAGVHAFPDAVANGTVTQDEVQGGATGEGDAVYDDRPTLRPYMSLNDVLICPLVEPVDIDGSKRDTIVRTAFDLWYGWKYAGHKGMNRLGDKWNWNDGGAQQAFSLISSTPLSNAEYGSKYTTTSHPGSNGTYVPNTQQDSYDSETGAEYNHRNYSTLYMTLTQWVSKDTRRGPSDLNAGYADLSVGRINGVTYQGDDRMALVPRFSTGKDWRNYHHLVPQR